MPEAIVLHGLIQKAARAHLEIEHRVDGLADCWIVYVETRTLSRWRKVAVFYCRDALTDFLVASLSTPEDHL